MMTKPELRAAAQQYIQTNEQDIVRNIRRLVEINSVRGDALPGAPFGAGPRRALEEARTLARELGLCAELCADAMCVACVPGSGAQTVGIIAHLDVVPEGNGWASPPFSLLEKEGYLIGRGVADDKGPAVLALYAAKFFADLAKETGTAPRHGIEVLLGSDEESGMGDIPLYLAGHSAPDFTFTPDGSFPVCNGEKGLFHANFVSPDLTGGFLRHLEGGVAHNVVPDRAFALLNATFAASLPTAPAGLTLSECADGVRLDACGKAGHASAPEGTVNAIGLIASYLLDNHLVHGAERDYLALLHDLFAAPDGSRLGIDSSDGIFSPLTIIGGMISMEHGVLTQTLDCRFPTSTSADRLAATLRVKAADAGASLEVFITDPPFYISADSAPIHALLNAYNDVTGNSAVPFVMGGGTYARHLPNAVSFGIEEEEERFPAFVGAIHGANEGFSLKKLLRALEIYIVALGDLMELSL